MSIQRSTVKASIKRRIGDIASTAFYADAFYNDIIDSRTKTLAGLVAQLAPNYYLEFTSYTGVTDAIDADHEFYQLPTNFRAFSRLERKYGTGASAVYESVEMVNAEDGDIYAKRVVPVMYLPTSYNTGNRTCSLFGTKLRIYPAPVDTGEVYRLIYMRQPVATSDDNDLLDVPDEWQEVLILDCAVFILAQTNDPTATTIAALLNKEVMTLKAEYRRRSMPTQGIPPLSHM
jgi:hypothetical protein